MSRLHLQQLKIAISYICDHKVWHIAHTFTAVILEIWAFCPDCLCGNFGWARTQLEVQWFCQHLTMLWSHQQAYKMRTDMFLYSVPDFITKFERCRLAIGVVIDASAWVANSGFGQDPLQSFKRLHFHGHHLATQAHWIIALPHPLSLAIIDRFLWGLDHPNVQLHLCYPTIWLIHAIRHLW